MLDLNKKEISQDGVALRIKEIREKLGLSQGKLSRIIGISRSAITQWENGTSSPDGENLLKCASALRVDPNWLQFGTEEQTTSNAIAYQKGEKLDIIKVLPLLDAHEIKKWIEHPKLELHQRTIRMALINKKLSDAAFAFEIKGSAMINSHDPAKSLVPGEIAIVDPSISEKVAADQLVLVDFGKDDLRIREYQIDGKSHFLKAFEAHIAPTPVNENIKIIGVIVETYRNKLVTS